MGELVVAAVAGLVIGSASTFIVLLAFHLFWSRVSRPQDDFLARHDDWGM